MADQDLAMEVAVEIVVREAPKDQAQPQYVVIMGDSPIHTPRWVEEVCVEVCAMNAQQATLTAKTIHTTGQAPVFRGDWDACILTRDKIRSKGGDKYAEEMGVPSKTKIPVWIDEG